MAIEIVRSLICDICKEAGDTDLDRIDLPSANLREKAKQKGWEIGRKDICPPCVKERCPNGCGQLDWCVDQYICPKCRDEFAAEIINAR